MRSPLLALLIAATLPLAARSASAREYTVPVDVGIGPAAYLITGPVGDDQTAHYGMKFNVEAVIDKEWIRKNPNAVPKKYRKQAKQVAEIRFSPSIFIPDAFFISPKTENTGIYGVTWRPVGLNLNLLRAGPLRFRAGGALLLTYAYVDSDVFDDTHFARPGLDLGAELELAFGRSFLVSGGWSSGVYVPQELGGFGFGERPSEDSIWHVGQAFLKLHVRFPYTVRR